MITDRHPGMVRHQLVELGYMQSAHTFGAASVAFNVQPRRTGQLLIGSSRELVGFDRRSIVRCLRRCCARASAFIPALRQRSRVAHLGWFPARDARQAAAHRPLACNPRVWIAAGHEGLGITMSTGTADLIVAGVLGTEPPVDPAPFRPDRPMPAWRPPRE